MIQANIVIQTAFLGDLILSVPLLKRIKAMDPDRKLIVVCKKGLADFLLREQLVDYAFEVEKSNSESYCKVLTYLENFELQNLYCIHRSIRSQLFSARIKAVKKVGFASMLGFWIFEDHIDFEESFPEVIRQFKILETTDSISRFELSRADFSQLTDIQGLVPEYFSFPRKLPKMPATKKIAVFPGSVWATKRWTQEGFTEVTRALISQGYSVDLMGGPDERALCQSIAAEVPGAFVLAGVLSIAESVQALANYDLVISNDSASAHMAAFNNTPVLAVFGPTTLALGFRPWSDNAEVVQNNEITCRPCGKHGPMVCPLKHHNCMKSITASQVLAVAEKMLTRNP